MALFPKKKKFPATLGITLGPQKERGMLRHEVFSINFSRFLRPERVSPTTTEQQQQNINEHSKPMQDIFRAWTGAEKAWKDGILSSQTFSH